MANFKRIAVVGICLILCGCTSLIVRPEKVILLPEERIFTIPAGQEVSVMLDKKPIKMTFTEDMKMVYPTVLVRQEEKLNNEMLKNIKETTDNNKKMGIIGSILAMFAAALGIFFKMKKWFPKKITGTIETK